ncbi:MAG: AmmeMemoRadiSam system protein A [Proteobacteria bacterium]|nr:AmmeMemoRadiSam system protein A [Pseudomonadota bacterium]
MAQKLSESEKTTLLKLARETISQYLKDGKRVPLPKAKGLLAEHAGAFVTLHKRGQLRGCIGNMIGIRPLVETIQEMAISAATEDPRFHRVQPEEMTEIDIEISVLSPMKRVKDVSEIEVGTHGILMRRGMYQGVLLPQVATEWGWDREEFLAHTCEKAGLPPDAWRDPETAIEIFSAEVFGEGQRPKQQ